LWSRLRRSRVAAVTGFIGLLSVEP
jgi:hypothetical protein